MVTTNRDFDVFANSVFSKGVKTLGTLCWFSISDVRIDEIAVNKLAANNGFTSKLKIKSTGDAFRVATSNCVKNAGVKTGRNERLIVRKVIDNEHRIVKAIVVETVNEKGETLDHYVAARARLERRTGHFRMTFNATDHTHRPIMKTLARQIEADYSDLRSRLTSGELRRWMMKHLKGMCYLSLLPGGGAYFVPSFNNERLQDMKNFIADLSEATNTSHTFGVLPVPDVQEQRELVVRSFVESFNDETKELLADVSDLLSKGDVSERAAKTRLARVREVMGKASEYRTNLGIMDADIDQRLEMLEIQASKLMDESAS